jgi:hypothetical protein
LTQCLADDGARTGSKQCADGEDGSTISVFVKTLCGRSAAFSLYTMLRLEVGEYQKTLTLKSMSEPIHPNKISGAGRKEAGVRGSRYW